MKLIIVSGLSGSGKSVTLDTLEDAGFYCTDNLPVALLPQFSTLLSDSKKALFSKAAVGIDARNDQTSLSQFSEFIAQLKTNKIDYDVIFLRANKESLLKRFSETRRKHPLSNATTSLDEAIDLELDRLSQIASHASIQIDTTHTNVHQLRNIIRERVCLSGNNPLSLQIMSFGYKHGAPNDVDFVFDARCLPNPYWEPVLRSFTGKDQPVIDFLDKAPLVQRYLNDISTLLTNWVPEFINTNRNYLSVAIGCTGGQHRSVYLTEKLARHLETQKLSIITRHRELG
ncbi:MAG: RNase adaptor protein RapZ [Cycloclasticus sp. symbiont of Bathymodiolus heckerae]|nr:MAG: RNase adaptor protein RapZ [Cycloclasticus sp. symbiont of Bathymodiolus heckerae]